MKIGSAFPSEFLKASDLDDSPVAATIKGIKMAEVGRDKDKKPIVYFEGKEKGLVLNKTNGKTIAKIANSEETDDWTGVKIILYPTETEFGGEMVDCIRVRAPKPAGSPLRKPAPPPASEDDFHAADDDVPFSFLLPILIPALTLAGGFSRIF
jgi:hypothetical protein